MPPHPSRSAQQIGAPPALFPEFHDKVLGVASHAALPLMLLERRNVGLHRLRKVSLAGTAFCMQAASYLCNLHISFSLFSGIGMKSGDDMSLTAFTLFVFVPLGIWQRVKRLHEEKLGKEPHTYWHGDGWWDFLPFQQKYLDMLVDPLVAFIGGALLRYRLSCGLLGAYFMLAAIALVFVEKAHYDQKIEHYRTSRNLMKEAEWDAQMLSQTEKHRQNSAGVTNATSIPTGDAGLADQIEKRRRELMNDRGVAQ